MSCVPNDLAEASKAFQGLDAVQRQAADTYLLAVIAGGSTDPAVLVEESKSFTGLSTQQTQVIQAYLLCQIANP